MEVDLSVVDALCERLHTELGLDLRAGVSPPFSVIHALLRAWLHSPLDHPTQEQQQARIDSKHPDLHLFVRLTMAQEAELGVQGGGSSTPVDVYLQVLSLTPQTYPLSRQLATKTLRAILHSPSQGPQQQDLLARLQACLTENPARVRIPFLTDFLEKNDTLEHRLTYARGCCDLLHDTLLDPQALGETSCFPVLSTLFETYVSQLRDQDCHSDNVSRLAAPKRNLRYQRNTLFCPLLRLLYRGHSEPDTAHHLWERVFLPALEECPSSCAEVFLYISELLEDIMCLNQKADAFDLRSEDSFWVYLQRALSGDNRGQHKHALLLLEQIIRLCANQQESKLWKDTRQFVWSKELSAALQESWSDFLTVFRTITDDSVHLLQPIFGLLDGLLGVSNPKTQRPAADPRFPLHFTWVAVLYSRAFRHQNVSVVKRSLKHALTCPLDSVPLADLRVFVSDSLFPAVCNAKILASSPKLNDLLHAFFVYFVALGAPDAAAVTSQVEFILEVLFVPCNLRSLKLHLISSLSEASSKCLSGCPIVQPSTLSLLSMVLQDVSGRLYPVALQARFHKLLMPLVVHWLDLSTLANLTEWIPILTILSFVRADLLMRGWFFGLSDVEDLLSWLLEGIVHLAKGSLPEEEWTNTASIQTALSLQFGTFLKTEWLDVDVRISQGFAIVLCALTTDRILSGCIQQSLFSKLGSLFGRGHASDSEARNLLLVFNSLCGLALFNSSDCGCPAALDALLKCEITPVVDKIAGFASSFANSPEHELLYLPCVEAVRCLLLLTEGQESLHPVTLEFLRHAELSVRCPGREGLGPLHTMKESAHSMCCLGLLLPIAVSHWRSALPSLSTGSDASLAGWLSFLEKSDIFFVDRTSCSAAENSVVTVALVQFFSHKIGAMLAIATSLFDQGILDGEPLSILCHGGLRALTYVRREGLADVGQQLLVCCRALLLQGEVAQVQDIMRSLWDTLSTAQRVPDQFTFGCLSPMFGLEFMQHVSLRPVLQEIFRGLLTRMEKNPRALHLPLVTWTSSWSALPEVATSFLKEIVDLATREPDRTVKADDDEGLSLSRAFALCDQDAVFARLYPNPFLYAIKNRIVVLSGVLAVVRQQKEVPAARLFVDDALAELQQFLVRDGKSSECSRFFFEPLAGVHAFHLSVILTEQGSSPTQALSFVRTLIDMFHQGLHQELRDLFELLITRLAEEHEEVLDFLISVVSDFTIRTSLAISVLASLSMLLLSNADLPSLSQYFSKVFPCLSSWISSHHHISSNIVQYTWDRLYKLLEPNEGWREFLSQDMYDHMALISEFVQKNREASKQFKRNLLYVGRNHRALLSLDSLLQLISTRDTVMSCATVTPILLEECRCIPGEVHSLLSHSSLDPTLRLELVLRACTLRMLRPLQTVDQLGIVPPEDEDLWLLPTFEQKAQQLQREEEERGVENFQRKFQPWNEKNLDHEINEQAPHQPKKRHPMIVIASLLDRAPNLGGLCRTSEIFNLEKLIVPSMHVLQDKVFQSTSVTSESWLPIEEVSPRMLEAYLLQLRSQGYTLLGLEQTSQSEQLHEFQFPEKCALLLGKEKLGIPPPLIRLLDHCIEIPQYGFVRSLNVHVSASVTIWEYIKQRVASSVQL